MTLRTTLTRTFHSAVLAAALLPAMASANSLPEGLERELDIFSEILRTSLKTADTGQLRTGNVTATWLAHQGVVLRLRISGGGRGWHVEMPDLPVEIDFDRDDYLDSLSDLEDIPGISAEMLENIPDIVNDALLSARIGLSNLSEERREALREQQDALREQQDRERELRDTLRDLRHDQRDLARELRNHEREAARGDSDADDNKEAARVRERLAELDRRQTEREQQLAAMRTELDSRRRALAEVATEARAKHKADLQAQWQRLDQALLDTVCTYGGTLRALPKGQHLTLMVDDAVRQDGKRGERIYVFRAQDLDGCSNPGNLRGKASIYDA